MYRLLAVVLMLGLAGSAFAVDLGNNQKTNFKSDYHVGQNPGTPDGREGGETVNDAVVIPSLPFTDTGNTCDNIHDYDEVCPYSGSTSPDVVYSFSPTADVFAVIDLCYSSYDTKVYVYDGHLNLVGCNDDAHFDPPCYTYSSMLEVLLNAGSTYYIVVDGYYGDCGDYQIDIIADEPCVVTCDPYATDEGEPELVDYYVDNYNGGCNSTPYAFQAYNWATEGFQGCGLLCGTSGWYYAGGDFRDTDWFEVVAGGNTLTVTVETEYDGLVYLLNSTSCTDITVADGPYYPEPCVPMTMNMPTTPGTLYWLFFAPSVFSGPVYEFTYTFEVCGHMYDVVPVDDQTWGGVKNLYR